MSAHLAFFALDAVAVFMLLLFGFGALLGNPRHLNARLIALIAFNSVCAVVLARQEMGPWIPEALRIDIGAWRVPFHIARNLTPGILMILSYSLFQDRKTLPRWLVATLIMQVALELWAALDPNGLSQHALLRTIPALLQLAFIVLALYWLVTTWRADLVEARRRLRIGFLVIVSVFTFVVVLLERVIIPWDSIAILYSHVASSALNIFVVAAAYLTTARLREAIYVDPFAEERKPVSHPATSSSQPEPRDPDLATVLRAFREQHVYRDNELTMASLADKLSLPEYRLRKLIHEQLGYRNFNALLHDYRIAEACRELHDPGKNHLPILTIALTVGYNSINPFNRAFREARGMTPSAFRAQNTQETAPILEK